jgi:CubicO group peptidase (beta-lactamase class C family)
MFMLCGNIRPTEIPDVICRTRRDAGLALLSISIVILFSTQPLFGNDIRSKVGEYLSAQVETKHFVGSILIADASGIIDCERYGTTTRPCEAADRYPLGSIAKQFTAVSILQLEAQGKLQIHDDACKYIKDCPKAWRQITILGLLTQTDGIPEVAFAKGTPSAKPPTDPSQVLTLIRDESPQKRPGETFSDGYSGYAVLDEIVQNVSHEPYLKYLQEHLFRPSGMHHTGFRTRFEIVRKRAIPSITPDDLTQSIPYIEGGIYSTVEDLYRWDRALYTRDLLPSESIDEMFHPQIDGQGFGWTIKMEFERHAESQESGLSFLSSSIQRYPETRTCVIVLSNGGEVNAATISHDLAAIMFDKHYEMPREHHRAVISNATFRSYVGQYVLPEGLSLLVFRDGRRLMIQGAGQKPAEIIPESETRFFVNGLDSDIAFVKDAKGRATKLVLQQGGRDLPAVRVESSDE